MLFLRLVADPATTPSHTPGMIGLRCIEAPANPMTHFLTAGGYGDALDEPRPPQPRIERQVSPAATVVE
jgi:hypothetical protein